MLNECEIRRERSWCSWRVHHDVVEIIGARFLAGIFGVRFTYGEPDRGGADRVGCRLLPRRRARDKWQRLALLGCLLMPSGLLLLFLPQWATVLINALIQRHAPDQPISPFWQKADPVLGSALVFLLPCVVLATLSPCLIRLSTRSLDTVGRSSGFIIAAGTVGSIAGVFVSGFVLIEHMGISSIFLLMGVTTLALGLACLALDRYFRVPQEVRA